MTAQASDAGPGFSVPPAGLPGADSSPGGARAENFVRLLTVVPPLLATAWLVTGLPLLLLGHFSPVPMLVAWTPVAVVLVVVAWRCLPGAMPAAMAGTPWWSAAALVLTATAFGIFQFAYHSQQIIVQRDPASYVQFGNWIARHGSLPIPDDLAAFGAPARLLSFFSPAFDPVGHSLAPQFMAGLPMTLAPAYWAGGVSTAVAVNAVLAACGVLAMGGLTARLVGARWAPLAALTLAVTLPEQYTARSDFSEPLAQMLFLGGLCLVVDSLGRDERRARWLAALGGLTIGLTLLVRIDGTSDLLPLIPYCGLLLLQRRPQAVPLILGTAVGASYGAVDGLVLTRPYLRLVEGSLVPVVLIGLALLAGTVVGVFVMWERGLPARAGTWLLRLAAGLPVAIVAALFVRPWLQTVHGSASSVVADFQREDHLPVQPTRLYSEISLHWVFWYVGVPAVVLATIGAAILARRCLQGRAREWILPLLCLGWIITTTLLRPGILPDQPWASRRLVPGVLPGVIVLAVWALAWLTGRLGRVSHPWRGAIVAVLAAALVLPAALTAFRPAVRAGGTLGARVTLTGLAVRQTYQGEIQAVRRMCAALPANASVIFVDRKTSAQLEQVVRGMCGVPAAAPRQWLQWIVTDVIRDIHRTGRQPVLLAATPQELTRFGGVSQQIMSLHSRSDAHTLVTPPHTTNKLTIIVWMSEPTD